jgi:hypothetical protein
MGACHRAFDACQDEAQLDEMRRAAMARRFGWSDAAAEYEALYRRLIGPRPVALGLKPSKVTRRARPRVADSLEPAA